MPVEERYCTNCRAVLAPRSNVCEACGVFAGDVFDGRMPKKKRSYSWILTLIVLALAGYAFWWAVKTTSGPPASPAKRVAFVAKAPRNERDGINAVRRYLLSTGARNECIALIGKGTRDGSYVIDAVDHCAHKSIGHFLVAEKSGKVTKR
jgi:hypothetical protein